MREFLADFDARPLALSDARGQQPLGMLLGHGSNALEVAVTQAAQRPAAADMRAIWKSRLDGRASPLVLVALYEGKAALCGAHGDHPPVYFDLAPAYAERLCAAALAEPDRHAALRFLAGALPQVESGLLGICNQGLFASHYLIKDVPRHQDWTSASTQALRAQNLRAQPLLEALGYRLEALPGPQTFVLRSAETRVAIALLLDRTESPDAPNRHFAGLSPIAYALARAEAEGVAYAMVLNGPALRLYPARPGMGAGQRGRTDTYFEIHLNLLTEAQAGYLWLIFSAAALAPSGCVAEFLRGSSLYAAELGKRLRERIYGDVIPLLAQGMLRARRLRAPDADDLAATYQMALLTLFRLLFIAYAEDQDLLPYRTNAQYQSRSLKHKARELARAQREGVPFGGLTAHWNEACGLFAAVDRGNPEWSVPAYNGGLFSADPSISPMGAQLARIQLPDGVFGPVLAALLVERTPEGPGPVDFRSLGVREFGTIYEGLLESELALADSDLTVDERSELYRPAGPKDEIKYRRGEAFLHNTSGQRKSTGSYFTKQFAVEHLLDQGLEPALQEHLARLDDMDEAAAAAAFFDFRVADLTMGSGHFLIAAVDRIERAFSGYLAKRALAPVSQEMARLRQAAAAASRGPAHPETAAPGDAIEDTQLLRRQIARRCIYGVDLNPMAVELARLAVWIHTFVPGLPLSFLDHNLVAGNSLAGIATVDEVRQWFEAINQPLFQLNYQRLIGNAAEGLRELARLSDASAPEIKAARAALARAQNAVAETGAVFDAICAARLDAEIGQTLAKEILALPGEKLQISPALRRHAQARLRAMPPFHFPIAFPEVFLRERPGFDVILGNPPWEEITVEEDRFWTRHHPGFHSLRQKQQEELKLRLHRERPDLTRKLELEIEQAKLFREVLITSPYPGMGTGDPDTYKAACWRFWTLCRQQGYVSVVLPRSALSAKGTAEFRKQLFETAAIQDVTTLLNRGGWVFDDAEPRYTISLTCWQRQTPGAEATLPLRGPYATREQFLRGAASAPARFAVREVLSWTDTAALPLLPSDESADVFLQLRRSPRLDAEIPGAWRVRPYREIDATNDKKWMKFANQPPPGHWPVFKGETFDIWQPDRGEYYAWADPKRLLPELQRRRMKSSQLLRSAFHGFPQKWLLDPGTLPCHGPRIAFRDVTNRTNRRTVIAALLPAEIFITNKGPYFIWLQGDEKDQAFVLGMLCSLPLDWFARCFVEISLNYFILNPFPIPRPARSSPLWRRCVELAGRLAAVDQRYAHWAKAAGVSHGPLDEEEKQNMIHELDAVAACCYGLHEGQLRHIFETFHEGWDYAGRMQATLRHFARWSRRI